MTTRQEMCKNVVQLCESRQHIVMCQTEQDIWNSLRPVSSSYFDFDLSLKLDLIYRSIEKAQIILRRFLLLFPVFYRVPVFISYMNLRNLHLYMLHHARVYSIYLRDTIGRIYAYRPLVCLHSSPNRA